jgi:hypothetical protein
MFGINGNQFIGKHRRFYLSDSTGTLILKIAQSENIHLSGENTLSASRINGF